MPSRRGTDEAKKALELEQEALRHQRAGDCLSAARTLKELVALSPEWEHGMAHYQLACCQEDLGQIAEANENYRKALEMVPDDPVRLGGYASFLFLHGDPSASLEVHLDLLSREANIGGELSSILVAIRELGKRLGLSEQDLDDQIETRLRRR